MLFPSILAHGNQRPYFQLCATLHTKIKIRPLHLCLPYPQCQTLVYSPCPQYPPIVPSVKPLCIRLVPSAISFCPPLAPSVIPCIIPSISQYPVTQYPVGLLTHVVPLYHSQVPSSVPSCVKICPQSYYFFRNTNEGQCQFV